MNHKFTQFISNHYLIIIDDDTEWTYRIHYDCDNDIHWVTFSKYSCIIGQQSRIDYLISNNIGHINNIYPSSQYITIILNPHILLEII